MLQSLSYRSLLGVAELRALLLTTCLSRLAGRMFVLTIVLYALQRTGSPALAGWLAFASLAPGLAISPVAGALIDRMGSAWAIGADMAASAGCIAVLLLLDAVGLASAPAVLVLTGLYSLTTPLSLAGIRALLPRLVAAPALDRANALDTAIHGLTDVTGPALAGILTGFGGPDLALGAIAGSYGGALLALGSLRAPRPPLPRLGPLLREARGGVVRVLRHPTLRGLAASYGLYEVCWGMLVVIVPVVTARQFAGGAAAAVAGLLWAGLGLVGGTAALAAGHLRTAGRERRIMALGMLATALAAWPIASEFGLPGLALGLMLVGAAAGPIEVGVLTLRQRRTDPAEPGRVLSVSMSLNISGGPLGSALAGLLVGWSLSVSLAVAAVASLLGAVAVALVPEHDDPRGPARPTTPSGAAPAA